MYSPHKEKDVVKIVKSMRPSGRNEITFLLLQWSHSSVLPRAYGLLKIHKANCSLRIIVSFINSSLYFFAAFLHGVIFNGIPKARSYIFNNFKLVEKLRSRIIDDQCQLVSLNVISLFTKVSLDLAIKYKKTLASHK